MRGSGKRLALVLMRYVLQYSERGISLCRYKWLLMAQRLFTSASDADYGLVGQGLRNKGE